MSNSYETPVPSRLRRWSRILFIDLLIFAIVYLGLQWWLGRDSPAGPAPELSGQTMNGRYVSLSDFRGRPVLLHFWASWCAICRFEHESIDNIAEDYAVITVMTRSGTEEEASAYLRKQNIDAPVILDEDGRLADSYNVQAVPASFIIDPRGEIADVEIGYSSELGLRSRLYLSGW